MLQGHLEGIVILEIAVGRERRILYQEKIFMGILSLKGMGRWWEMTSPSPVDQTR